MLHVNCRFTQYIFQGAEYLTTYLPFLNNGMNSVLPSSTQQFQAVYSNRRVLRVENQRSYYSWNNNCAAIQSIVNCNFDFIILLVWTNIYQRTNQMHTYWRYRTLWQVYSFSFLLEHWYHCLEYLLHLLISRRLLCRINESILVNDSPNDILQLSSVLREYYSYCRTCYAFSSISRSLFAYFQIKNAWHFNIKPIKNAMITQHRRTCKACKYFNFAVYELNVP